MASKIHEHVKALLEEIYPSCPIVEEYPIKVDNRNLRIDLFVTYPFNVAVECQGEQHYKFVPHFHRTKSNFRDALRRDRVKENWCFEHYVALVYVDDGDFITKEELKRRIEEAEKALDKHYGVCE